MGWNTTNALKEAATPEHADETRRAICVKDGIITTSSGGETVTFATAFSSVDDYAVTDFAWQEDPGPNAGVPYPVKSLGSCLIKVTGTGYGKKLYYRVVEVKNL